MVKNSKVNMSAITALLEPKSIVVIGASEDPTRIGGRPLRFLRDSAFDGVVYAVNPNREHVQGFPSFPNVSALPVSVDLAIIALPAGLVIRALEDCGRKFIKTAIVFSAGFSEVGAVGLALQIQIGEIAVKYGIRVLGPNCLGAFNSHIGFYGTFTQAFSTGFVKSGSLAVVSQSGACGGHLAYLCRQRNIGIGYWITTGNEADLDLSECLQWLVQSSKVRVIVAYVESIRNGPRFMDGLREARRLGKPIILLKVGRSASGVRAAASHTGALAGEDSVYGAIFKQFGVYRANSIEEMLDIAYVCLAKEKFGNNRLGIITVSGGVGVQIADAADEWGVDVPILPEAAQSKIKEIIPFAGTSNPIDVTAQLTNDRSLLGRCLDIAISEGEFGAVICFLTSAPASRLVAESMLVSLKQTKTRFPDILFVLSFIAPIETVRDFENEGFLVFEDTNRAVKALAALSNFEKSFRSHRELERTDDPLLFLPNINGIDFDQAGVFDEYSAKKVLATVGVPSLPEVLAFNPEEVRKEVEKWARPVALKIVSPDILHKTEIEGVALNISSSEDAYVVARDMLKRVVEYFPSARIRGILVSPMCEKGVETICGVYQDPVFGPVVLFGLGGVYVEILKDFVLRLAPFDHLEALSMIREIRGAAILDGIRGGKPSDVNALAHVLSKLSMFAFSNRASISEIDINPFMVLEAGKGGFALDALITRVVNIR